jgi:hypothetical protein
LEESAMKKAISKTVSLLLALFAANLIIAVLAAV